MKIMGLETARSSTPAYFRDKLYAAFKIIIGKTNDELIAFINGVRTETKERPYEEVAFPRGVNNLAKYRHPQDIYSKGTPIAVRGALLYNHYVKKHKVENKHPLIQEGEKIKFMYLKLLIQFMRIVLVSLVSCLGSLALRNMWIIKHNLKRVSWNL